MGDPYEDFLEHDAQAEEWLNRLPVCDYCGEPIQDDYFYRIGDECICEHCLESEFRVSNDCL